MKDKITADEFRQYLKAGIIVQKGKKMLYNEDSLIKEEDVTKKRKHKYNAKKTKYNGFVFDSKKEAEYCMKLDLLMKSGEVIQYDKQVPFKYFIDGKHIFTYKLDFKVFYKDGRIEYVDVKGVKTPVYRLKKKIIEAFYKIKIIEI